jgi:hypothetical protein
MNSNYFILDLGLEVIIVCPRRFIEESFEHWKAGLFCQVDYRNEQRVSYDSHVLANFPNSEKFFRARINWNLLLYATLHPVIKLK